ncbi:alpha/beta fold hydrolase [Coraliomargarita sp. SDUM461004]|uniref:Alpha/beta fold hydrolase n=1 Tax=Thalassobacterium sedimentorum TaxID=3041258 RepID=A0ABU1AHH7_9BACT|nr:alpha/beta fold hydrolase [Coraliomargarita sp. SDUM461004]MDQ8194274.1 alpha/beta fold hydrolase [Coraliomargarita sp. SDUM461004]
MQILALHGFTGCGSDFAPFAELVGAQWHCPDLPGHAANSQLPCKPADMIDFIEHERHNKQLQTAAPKILLGYSMGARAALVHACQQPAAWDALILISANPGIADDAERVQRRSTDAELASSIESKGLSAFLEFWQQTPMIRSQKNIRSNWRTRMQANRGTHTTAGLARNLREFGQGSVPNLWPRLGKLSIPTLLITGQEDTKYTQIARQILAPLSASRKPAWKHAIIDSVGHAPHLEAPEFTASTIRQFLNNSLPQ